MSPFRILVVIAISLGFAAPASISDRLAEMHKHHPKADANGDGRLTEREAMDYVVRVTGRRINRGPVGNSPELLEAFTERVHQGTRYRLLQPLAIEPGKRYPLILSLHGGGGPGDDNLSQLRWWNVLMAKDEWRRAHPSFVLAPQAAPAGSWGERSEVGNLKNLYIKNMIPIAFELIDSLLRELPVDASRIYVLGASGGGTGTWNFVRARPAFFAAAIPVCAGNPPQDAAGLTGTPIWAFHGADDQLAPVENSRRMFEQVGAAGGTIKYTEMQGVKHNSWIQAFTYQGDDSERGFVTNFSGEDIDPTSRVWDWLFRQRRGNER